MPYVLRRGRPKRWCRTDSRTTIVSIPVPEKNSRRHDLNEKIVTAMLSDNRGGILCIKIHIVCSSFRACGVSLLRTGLAAQTTAATFTSLQKLTRCLVFGKDNGFLPVKRDVTGVDVATDGNRGAGAASGFLDPVAMHFSTMRAPADQEGSIHQNMSLRADGRDGEKPCGLVGNSSAPWRDRRHAIAARDFEGQRRTRRKFFTPERKARAPL